MGFDIGSAVNGGAEAVCRSKLAAAVIRNPVITALLVTALCLVIVYAIYGEQLKKAGWRRGVQAGLYLLAGVSVLTFLHYYALRQSLECDYSRKGITSIVDSVHQGYSGGRSKGHVVDPDAAGVMEEEAYGDGRHGATAAAWGAAARPGPYHGDNVAGEFWDAPGPSFVAPAAYGHPQGAYRTQYGDSGKRPSSQYSAGPAPYASGAPVLTEVGLPSDY